jgi:hypothetical protein
MYPERGFKSIRLVCSRPARNLPSHLDEKPNFYNSAYGLTSSGPLLLCPDLSLWA